MTCGSTIEIGIGDSATLHITVVENNPTEDPVSLTGERVVFILKPNLTPASTALIVKDSDNGPTEIEILLAPDDNQALIKLTDDDTDEIPEGDYCYVVKSFFTAEGAKTVTKGLITFYDSAFESIPPP